MNDSTEKHTPEAIETFIARWQDTCGKERANYQLLLTELCRPLDLPGPESAGPDPAKNGYVLERRSCRSLMRNLGGVGRQYRLLWALGSRLIEQIAWTEQVRV